MIAPPRPPEFVPAPALAHPLLQTVYGAVLRRLPDLPDRARERWEMPDGDFLDVEVVRPASEPPRGFVIVIHGLEGSPRSSYARGALHAARQRGLIGYALTLRSCGDEDNRLARTYHTGFTDDLRFAILRIVARHPHLRGAVIGFSLGANIALKWLGEEGRAAPEQVAGAVAISCPFDLATCAAHLDSRAGWVFRYGFLRSMKAKALRKAARFPGQLDPAAIRRARTFREFDTAVTAPLFGFRDAEDYWARAGCAPLLGGIARPALLISAEDDPLIPAACIPRDAPRRNQALALEATAHGGHVGFVGGTALAPRFWAEERAFDFVEALLARA